jgi:hypothetical protein
VRVGDRVLYEGGTHAVAAVVREGLWEPYFDLPEVGLISHQLVEPAGREAVEAPAAAPA